MKSLETKRMILRDFRLSDLADLVLGLNNYNIYRWTLHVPYPYTEEEGIRFLELEEKRQKSAERTNFKFALTIDDKVIGSIRVEKMSGESLEIGYWLAEPMWGKGLMTEVVLVVCNWAFDYFKAKQITAYTFAENLPSQNVLVKSGFKKIKFLPKRMEKDGKKIDEYFFKRCR